MLLVIVSLFIPVSNSPLNHRVSYSEASALAQSWGVPYIECSSKTGECVAEVFHVLLKEIEKDDGLLTEADPNPCIIQ